MSTVQEIEHAVSLLPKPEPTLFREWFDEFEATLWDEQIASDAATGKLDQLANQALEDFRSGNFKEL